MTIEQKLGMVRMRLEGASLQEIGDAYKCSRQYVAQVFDKIDKIDKINKASCKRGRKCKNVYPVIAQAMNEKGYTNVQLAEATGITVYTIRNILSGKTLEPGIFTAQKIASALGLPLKKAFLRDENTDDA